ncbi:MAG: protease modulator HflC [Solobacterium sp.]|nr:protease modulator HflC [Solobacterium sp.]
MSEARTVNPAAPANSRKGLLLIPIILIAVVLFSSIYVVHEKEYIVIRQFGRITAINDNPGLGFKIPFVQTAESITKEILFYDIPESDVITRDKKSMVVDSFVLWKVTDPDKYIRTLNAVRGRADERIEASVYNAVKNTISSMTQDEVIASRGEALTTRITDEANSDIGQYGVEILTAQIKTLSLPADNLEAVYARMISERENIAAGYEATGNSQAQKIRNETDKEVKLLIAEANKQAAILEAEGEEEYMRILQEAYNSEEKADFYEFIRGLDSLKESLTGSKRKTLILDKNSELVKILYGN